MAKQKCVICGEDGYLYFPFCKKHLEMKKDGLIVKNEKNEKWEIVNNNYNNTTTIDDIPVDQEGKIINYCLVCGQKINNFDNFCTKHKEMKTKGLIWKNFLTNKWEETNDLDINHCLICGKETEEKLICKDCYWENIDFQSQIDKNLKFYELENYYYNLQNNIFRILDYEKVKSNCNKLMAIAKISYKLFEKEDLINRVVNDVKKLLINKKPKTNIKITEFREQEDAKQTKIYPTYDGHIVESKGEETIDNILYTNKIVHSYAPNVVEINPKIEKAIEADWFIPILSPNKGIYVEYWGMTTKNYLENKKRKLKQYQEHNIPLIEIEKDEINNNRLLETKILREISELAEKYYNVSKL